MDKKQQNVDIVTLESETNSTPPPHAMQQRNIVSLTRDNSRKQSPNPNNFKRGAKRGPNKKSIPKLASFKQELNSTKMTSNEISLTASSGPSPAPPLLPKSDIYLSTEVSITPAEASNKSKKDDAPKNNSSGESIDSQRTDHANEGPNEEQEPSNKLIMSNNDELEIEEFMELVDDDGRELETVSEVTLNTSNISTEIASLAKGNNMVSTEENEFPLAIKKIDFSGDNTKKSDDKQNPTKSKLFHGT